jgi:hypothetical protein
VEQEKPSVWVEIEGKTTRLIIDTGSNVLILQPGVSRARIVDTHLEPFGVSVENLDIKGMQSVSFVFAGQKFTHEFLVYSLPTEASGLLGMDFMESRNAQLSLKAGKMTLTAERQLHKSTGPRDKNGQY